MFAVSYSHQRLSLYYYTLPAPEYLELVQGAAQATDATYVAHKAASIQFSHAMEKTWQLQKMADMHSNGDGTGDGDIDMEKGFVNNRSPWGVDPAVNGEEKELSHEEMASRLEFLLQGSESNSKVAHSAHCCYIPTAVASVLHSQISLSLSLSLFLYGESKGTQDKDFAYSFSDSLFVPL